ncbi:hypothetical protein ACOMHN_065134 [Nucella lapillus]
MAARAGGLGARAGGPGARAGDPGARAGGPGARAGGRFRDPDGLDAEAEADGAPGGRMRGPGARVGGPRARAAAGLGEEEEDALDSGMGDEEAPASRPRGRIGAAAGRATGRFAGAGSRAQASASTEENGEDTEGMSTSAASKRRAKGRKSKENQEKDEDDEKAETTEAPKKKEPPYPEWWKTSYPRSAVSSLQEQFVGDQPLFTECPNFNVAGVSTKSKRYGHVDRPNYMHNSKNPCWFEWNGKKDTLKCLPYFYLAGAAKAAVADLFKRVSGHPKVMVGGSSSYFWWDRLRYGASKTLKYTHEAKRTGDAVSMKEYAKELVGKHGKNLTKELLYQGKSESIFGDATPTYLTENTQWSVFEGNEGCSEPRVIPANFIRHIFPDARIVIILRDPVERLYSRFLANVPYVQEFENATASLFHTFTVQAIQTYRECFAKTSVRHCAYNASLFSNAVIRLSEGMYPIFLEDWFRVFPREQILVLQFEEYVQSVKGHLLKVFDHLGLDNLDEYYMLKLTDIPVTRKGRTREEEGYMMPETASLLADFYSPFMLKLADMLGDDKWLYTRHDLQYVRKNLEAHEEGGEDVMPATGQQQQGAESPPEDGPVEDTDV